MSGPFTALQKYVDRKLLKVYVLKNTTFHLKHFITEEKPFFLTEAYYLRPTFPRFLIS